jgi:hypothetical protein
MDYTTTCTEERSVRRRLDEESSTSAMQTPTLASTHNSEPFLFPLVHRANFFPFLSTDFFIKKTHFQELSLNP